LADLVLERQLREPGVGDGARHTLLSIDRCTRSASPASCSIAPVECC
jgi:hypothetical protein